MWTVTQSPAGLGVVWDQRGLVVDVFASPAAAYAAIKAAEPAAADFNRQLRTA